VRAQPLANWPHFLLVLPTCRNLRRIQPISKITCGLLKIWTFFVSFFDDAYIWLVGQEPMNWDNWDHFFKAAAEAIRRILVENAQTRRSIRGGGFRNKIVFQK